MPREVIYHHIADLPEGFARDLSVVAADGDKFGIPHHYFLCEEKNGLRGMPVQELKFQSGDPRSGWNGGTTLAYLAAILDFLDCCEKSQFHCPENARAIAAILSAITDLQARIRRRASEGTFQTHQGEPHARPVVATVDRLQPEEMAGLLAEADHAESTGANGGMVLLNPVFLRRILALLPPAER